MSDEGVNLMKLDCNDLVLLPYLLIARMNNKRHDTLSTLLHYRATNLHQVNALESSARTQVQRISLCACTRKRPTNALAHPLAERAAIALGAR